MNTETLRERLRTIFADRAPEGIQPKGDIQILKPEFIDYSDDGWLTVEFLPQEWQENGLKKLQGGVLAYMLDCVFGPFAYVISEGSMSGTLDMTTNYLRPVFADGTRITVKARFITNSKRTMHGEGTLFNGEGKPAVTASTNIMKKSPEQKSVG